MCHDLLDGICTEFPYMPCIFHRGNSCVIHHSMWIVYWRFLRRWKNFFSFMCPDYSKGGLTEVPYRSFSAGAFLWWTPCGKDLCCLGGCFANREQECEAETRAFWWKKCWWWRREEEWKRQNEWGFGSLVKVLNACFECSCLKVLSRYNLCSIFFFRWLEGGGGNFYDFVCLQLLYAYLILISWKKAFLATLLVVSYQNN